MPKTIYLARSSTQVICFCKCATSLIGSPSQMDCPWCGCGWLFTCMSCGKAFTFARGIEVDYSIEDLAEMDLVNRLGKQPSPEQIASRARAMNIMLRDVRPGEQYVYLDGYYIPVKCRGARFEGWHAHHDLAELPHVQALKDPAILEQTLGMEAYWRQRETEAYRNSR